MSTLTKLSEMGSRCLKASTLGIGLSVFMATASVAQSFPEKPIEMIIGFKAGGFADAMGRTLAEPFHEIMGQPLVAVNVPGAGGGVAAVRVANAQPDGYTLVNATSITFALTPLLGHVDFSTDDFDYLLTMARYESAFVSRADKPWSDFEAMIVYAKENGMPLRYSTNGPADRAQIDFIANKTGVVIIPIPAKGGADAMQKLLGNHVDFAFSGGVHLQYVQSGDMIVLAAAGSEKLNGSPEAKTMTELGYPAVTYDAVVAAPKGIPEDVRAKLEEALVKAAKDPRFQKLVMKRNVAIEPIGSDRSSKSVLQAAKEMSDMLATVKK